MDLLMHIVGPILAGGVSWWASNKCRGRNAQRAFRFAAFGFWLLLLPLISFGWLGFPFILLDFLFVKWIPSVLLFLAAGNSVLKEMRAQQRGDYTEKAL